jgi:hypothetical protein
MPGNEFTQLAISVTVEKGLQPSARPAHGLDRFVMHRVPQHFVSARLEQSGFSFERLIFAAALLIIVMANEDSHARAKNNARRRSSLFAAVDQMLDGSLHSN